MALDTLQSPSKTLESVPPLAQCRSPLLYVFPFFSALWGEDCGLDLMKNRRIPSNKTEVIRALGGI